MKLAMISDIHLDVNRKYPVLACIRDVFRENNADALLVAGDIAENLDALQGSVLWLEYYLEKPVFYVPGNHDLWDRNEPERSTDDIYEAFRKDIHCLSGKHVTLKEGVELVGDAGWYDYSLGDSSFSKEEYDAMTCQGRTWQDHNFNDWTRDNKAANERMLAELKKHLDECEPGARIIVMTHMLPNKLFTVPTARREWGYFNAFLGSDAYQALYEQYPVTDAICGHVHYRKKEELNGITYHCVCLNYWNEWHSENKDCMAEVRQAMSFLEV